MSDAIITVENLGKKYRISHQGERQRYTALRDVIAEKAKGFFKKLKTKDANAEKLKTEKLKSGNDFSVSACQRFKNSACQRFRVCRCQRFSISACQRFLYGGLLGFARCVI
jgi:hypothetical protein